MAINIHEPFVTIHGHLCCVADNTMDIPVPGMMLQHLTTQRLHGDMRVNLSSADTFMSKKCLNDAQVGAAFKQSRSERMS